MPDKPDLFDRLQAQAHRSWALYAAVAGLIHEFDLKEPEAAGVANLAHDAATEATAIFEAHRLASYDAGEKGGEP